MIIADMDSLFQADGVFALGKKVKVPSKQDPKVLVDSPKKEKFFVIRPGTFEDKAFLEAVIAKYGETPHELPITFLSNVPDEIFPYYWMRWSGPGVLACKGDGRKVMVVEGEAPRPCLGRDCEYAKVQPPAKSPKCKMECTLYFALYEIDMTKKCRTGSHGFFSIQNLRKVIEKEYHYQVKGLGFLLRLVPKTRPGRGQFFSLEIHPTGQVIDLGGKPPVELPKAEGADNLRAEINHLRKALQITDKVWFSEWSGGEPEEMLARLKALVAQKLNEEEATNGEGQEG